MTQVIIDDILPRTQAIAVGSQQVYSTDWTADVAADVLVYSRATGVDADDATQQLATNQYSVAFIGDERIVEVTLVNPSTAGDIVTIIRNTPADRLNLYSNTNFTPSMLNNDFGILTLVDQQAQLVNQLIGPRYNYSAVINPSMSFPTADTILPILAANQFWAKNASDNEIIAMDIGDITGGGTVTEVDTGTGLTGGPITGSGIISFASIPANTLWANITGSTAVPTAVSTSYFVKTTDIGVTVEAWSPALDSIAGLTTSANQLIYTTASNTYAVLSAIANAALITSAGSVPSFSQTLPNAVQTNITRLGAQAIALDMNSHQINNVTDPTNPQDAATMAYVTAQTTGSFLPLIGGTMSGQINMGNEKIVSMANPSSAQDAVTLSYLNTALNDYLALSGGTMTGAINMGSSKITNLLDPTNPQDAATKNYVDLFATGLAIQVACEAATTADLNAIYVNGASGIGATLTNAGALAALVIDGYSVQTNDRILAKNQSSTLQNGIYTATNIGSGAVAWILTRATDYDQPAEIQPGDLVIINNGTANGGASFIETASVSAIGTDPILFSQFTFSATSVLLKANNLSDVANTVSSFNNISPTTTKGDIIVDDGSNDVRLAVGGSDGQILRVKAAASTGLAYSTATYPDTTTVSEILYSSSTNVIGGITTNNGGVLVTDNTGVPSMLTNPGVAGKILQSANAAIPAWSTPTYPSTSGTLGKFLISDGTNNVYSTSTIPTSAGATSGKIVVSDGTNYILSTPTFPNASATSGKIIKSDGTNWIASTETYAAPGTSGNIMTSDGTNWTSAPNAGITLLTTKGDLFGFSTVNARLPVVSGNGKVLQVDSTAALGLSYSTPTYPSTSGSVGKFLISDGTNNVYSTSTIPTSAGATANKLLLSDGTNYVLSTPTYPNASATSRKIIVSDGTNFVASTETWATPSTSGNVLTSDGTNWTSATPDTAGAWTDFSGSITVTGCSGTPTIGMARKKVIGKTCFFNLQVSGTSNATSFTVTGMPNTCAATMVGGIMSASNNSVGIYNAAWLISTSGTTLQFTVAQNLTGWTNSGTKAANIMGFYETT